MGKFEDDQYPSDWITKDWARRKWGIDEEDTEDWVSLYAKNEPKLVSIKKMTDVWKGVTSSDEM